MKHYVIGEDKSLEEALTATEVNERLDAHADAITALQAKAKTITSGTAAPTGGSNGDIYIQY